MDHQRVHRIGHRTYYRNSYAQSPNSRPTIEERLHAQGISTSSNSSWTFSNSHSDIPRKKKGRLCGLFLMVAVVVVLLVVIAIGVLAFYLGVMRVDNPKQELIFDGSLRITYGDQYQAALGNRSTKIFQEKALRYSNMIANVYQRSLIAPALEEVKVLKFENGSLIVHFRMHLDRRKLLSSVTSVEEILKNILLEEISSLKPVAFRNLQVDYQNLYIKRYLGDINSLHEISETGVNNRVTENNMNSSPKTVEVKNGVVRKVPEDNKSHSRHENRTTTIPEGAIIGISEKMQNLSDTLKKRMEESGEKTSTTPNSAEQEGMKSSEFDKGIGFGSSDEVKSQTTDNEESSIVGDVHLVSSAPGNHANKHSSEYGLTTDDKNIPMNGHARPPFELKVDRPIFYTSTQVTPNSGFLVSDYDEPWRPIIPSQQHQQIPTKEKLSDVYDEIVMAEGGPERDSPITFSRESYEENLRVSPEYANKKVSKITEDIAKKYEQLFKTHKISSSFDEASPLEDATQESKITKNDTVVFHSNDFAYDSNLPLGLDQIMSGISVIGGNVDEQFVEPTAEMAVTADNVKPIVKLEETTTSASSEVPITSNVTLKNPFAEAEDSRSAPVFGFDLPDFPMLKQFHHLDSLLKSFSSNTPHDDLPRPFIFVNDSSITRFPVRTKATTEKLDDKVFVAVSTIAPETTIAKQKVEMDRSPIVIKGEVQVLDSKNIGTDIFTTEQPKLITLLPVRSNVKGPLRPRPKVIDSTGVSDNREPKSSSTFKSGGGTFPRILYSIPQKHHFIDDKDGKRWVYYSSSKLLTTTSAPNKPEKLFIVTPENGNKIISTPSKPIGDEVTDQAFRDSAEGREDTEREVNMSGACTNTSELINRIVNIMENVAISTGNSTHVILKVNQTIINGTVFEGSSANDSISNDPKYIISTKAVSSQYKLNQAGIPILTKILNKAPNYYKNEGNETIEKKELEAENLTTPLMSIECDNNSVACGNGTCLPLSARCNQQIDCPDAVDEKNCSCAEHLRTQHFNRKLCDGIVDCWDFSDEFGCDWCKGKDYLCSSSKMCIKKSQICDGANNCPLGDDERYCVTVSPNKKEANSFNYHPNGYLMVRKHGEWGKLCIDNFDAVSMKSKTGWKISDLGRSVCKALTFKDFDKVERMISVPNEGRSFEKAEGDRYYELSYNDVAGLEESSTRDSTLSFHETECVKKEVVKVTCTDLECGLRPQAMNQWSRIVGGGNANPGSWPWQAALYKEGEFQCGATLISGHWLVSAGHCFYHNQDEYWVARLGTLRTTSSLPSPYEQLRQISKIILHPHYVDTGFINDISLLKMADPVIFTDYVRPICLPKSNAKIIDGMMCTVVGWGQLFEIGRIFPDTLQEVQLPIISSTECRKRTVFLPLYKITDDMFCAGFDRGGRDACLGDSGGPLMCQESDGKWSLYGVTSNGYGCARSNRPGVYTKVSKYLHWLQSQMHLYSEDDTLNQSGLKRLSPLSSDHTTANDSMLNDNHTVNNEETDALIKIISERISNVKFSTATVKKKDKCKGHRCPLGECLSKNRLCNGLIECSDGSDEKDCW